MFLQTERTECMSQTRFTELHSGEGAVWFSSESMRKRKRAFCVGWDLNKQSQEELKQESR